MIMMYLLIELLEAFLIETAIFGYHKQIFLVFKGTLIIPPILKLLYKIWNRLSKVFQVPNSTFLDNHLNLLKCVRFLHKPHKKVSG